MENILNVRSVADYNLFREHEFLNPLVTVVDFSKVKPHSYTRNTYHRIRFDVYAIFLKDVKCADMKYGLQNYDYEEGTLVFIAPNQTVELTNYKPDYRPQGFGLLFHPDLLLGTPLAQKIHQYNFFSYSVNEALHLSAKERKVILSLLEKIQFELEQTIDKHSRKLIVANIELFLDYCQRFYDRQFLTRETAHRGQLEKFESLLHDYLHSDKPHHLGTPSVAYFAEALHLSPNYFGDLVKKETGFSALEYIQQKLIEVAKDKVFNPEKSVSQIAFELGFKYPQHFSRLFKQKVGVAPNEFRNLN